MIISGKTHLLTQIYLCVCFLFLFDFFLSFHYFGCFGDADAFLCDITLAV